VVLIRDRWLRGGLTLAIDHGGGVITQVSHLARVLVGLGDVVQRGECIALSGVSGLDLCQFFPWVPPHVHFLVWRHGLPLDPFCQGDEDSGSGKWLGGKNMPLPADERAASWEKEIPEPSAVDQRALAELVDACTDPGIATELRSRRTPLEQAALLEDALHHDCWAWPKRYWRRSVRPPVAEDRALVQLTLPLPASDYSGARFADAPWTRPHS
jgi:hypothetical protein